jgi:hypothetical protein
VELASFYSLIQSGQTSNILLALELSKALAMEDKFFVDFNKAVQSAYLHKCSGSNEIEFLKRISKGILNIVDLNFATLPAEWYTFSILIEILRLDKFKEKRLPVGLEMFHKCKQLTIDAKNEFFTMGDICHMESLEEFNVNSDEKATIGPDIALCKKLKILRLYSAKSNFLLPAEIKNLSTLETLCITSNFDGIQLKELSLKELRMAIFEIKNNSQNYKSSIGRINREDALPETLEKLRLQINSSEPCKKFIRDNVNRLRRLTDFELIIYDNTSFEIGEGLLGLKSLKKLTITYLSEFDLDFLAQLPYLENIVILGNKSKIDVDFFNEKLCKLGSNIKIV